MGSGRDSMGTDSCGAGPLLPPPTPEGRVLTMPRTVPQGMMGGDALSAHVGKGWIGLFVLIVWVHS